MINRRLRPRISNSRHDNFPRDIIGFSSQHSHAGSTSWWRYWRDRRRRTARNEACRARAPRLGQVGRLCFILLGLSLRLWPGVQRWPMGASRASWRGRPAKEHHAPARYYLGGVVLRVLVDRGHPARILVAGRPRADACTLGGTAMVETPASQVV